VWVFHSAERSGPTARSIAEEKRSRLKTLRHRELDLVSRLSVLYERSELYPREVTKRQVAELNRKLDEIRAEIDALRAEVDEERG
jgi:cell division protein FtsB